MLISFLLWSRSSSLQKHCGVAFSKRTPDCFCWLTFLSSCQSSAIDSRENLDWTLFFSAKEIKNEKNLVHKCINYVLRCWKIFFFSWSCGVRSCWALHQLQKKSNFCLGKYLQMLWFPLDSFPRIVQCHADESGPHNNISWPQQLQNRGNTFQLPLWLSQIKTILLFPFLVYECWKCHWSHSAYVIHCTMFFPGLSSGL